MLEVREKATISQTLKDGDTVLTEQQQNNLQAWEEMQKPFDQELIDEDVKGYQGSYSDSFKLSIKWMEAQATYLFNYAIFDILVMFFIGAALMKLGF
jgi:Ca2+-dependent lipid-binding protein